MKLLIFFGRAVHDGHGIPVDMDRLLIPPAEKLFGFPAVFPGHTGDNPGHIGVIGPEIVLKIVHGCIPGCIDPDIVAIALEKAEQRGNAKPERFFELNGCGESQRLFRCVVLVFAENDLVQVQGYAPGVV